MALKYVNPPSDPIPLWRTHIDSRLVSTVHRNAGAHIHEAANLVAYYYLALQLRHECLLRRDRLPQPMPDEELNCRINDAEMQLRRFSDRSRRQSSEAVVVGVAC
jgi:hypothetical protein